MIQRVGFILGLQSIMQ